MSPMLEGIMNLMRGCEALPANMSRTEITHYAREMLSKLRSGENVETLDLYLRRTRIYDSRNVDRDLAKRAFDLFNNSK